MAAQNPETDNLVNLTDAQRSELLTDTSGKGFVQFATGGAADTAGFLEKLDNLFSRLGSRNNPYASDNEVAAKVLKPKGVRNALHPATPPAAERNKRNPWAGEEETRENVSPPNNIYDHMGIPKEYQNEKIFYFYEKTKMLGAGVAIKNNKICYRIAVIVSREQVSRDVLDAVASSLADSMTYFYGEYLGSVEVRGISDIDELQEGEMLIDIVNGTEIGGAGVTWGNGYITIKDAKYPVFDVDTAALTPAYQYTIPHELGHNVGLQHPNEDTHNIDVATTNFMYSTPIVISNYLKLHNELEKSKILEMFYANPEDIASPIEQKQFEHIQNMMKNKLNDSVLLKKTQKHYKKFHEFYEK